MPEMKKGVRNDSTHSLSIDDRICSWLGWPVGPYADKGPSDAKKGDVCKVKNSKDEWVEVKKDKDGKRSTYKSDTSPFINIEQRSITDHEYVKAMKGADPTWKATAGDGIDRCIILRWTE